MAGDALEIDGAAEAVDQEGLADAGAPADEPQVERRSARRPAAATPATNLPVADLPVADLSVIDRRAARARR